MYTSGNEVYMEKKTDLRIEKTEKAIKNAFIELRAKSLSKK